jgi:hypothetical protein
VQAEPRARAQPLKCLERAIPPADPQFRPREIPLRQRAPGLLSVVAPAAEFVPRLLALGGVELVKLRKHRRQRLIRRPPFDEIFEQVVARARRVRLQMSIGDREERGDQHLVARTFRLLHDRTEELERALAIIALQLHARAQETPLLPFRRRSRPHGIY